MRCFVLVALVACGDNVTLPVDVIAFTDTSAFRHEASIEAAREALPDLLAPLGLAIEITNDARALEDLEGVRAVMFLYTSGNDLVTPRGRDELEAFVRRGGGFVGLHSAADTEYEWPFYQELIVASFQSHTAVIPGVVVVEDRGHPATLRAPDRWAATDEWYNFQRDPSGDGVRVLLTVDGSTIGGAPSAVYPIAWTHARLGGRAFYSALGHVPERWTERDFVEHVTGGVTSVLGPR